MTRVAAIDGAQVRALPKRGAFFITFLRGVAAMRELAFLSAGILAISEGSRRCTRMRIYPVCGKESPLERQLFTG